MRTMRTVRTVEDSGELRTVRMVQRTVRMVQWTVEERVEGSEEQ
jgi:hypothetical protein